MKPRSLVKLERKAQTKKNISSVCTDCNDYFSSIITNNLVNNEKEMKSYEK